MMKSKVKFLLLYVFIALSSIMYGMHEFDFSGSGHAVAHSSKPVEPLPSFDDLLARHMDSEHSVSQSPVVHTMHDLNYNFGSEPTDMTDGEHSAGSYDFSGSNSLSLSTDDHSAVVHTDPDEDLTSLGDLNHEQHGEVMMKIFADDHEGAKQLAKQYRQQNRAEETFAKSVIEEDRGSLDIGSPVVARQVEVSAEPSDDDRAQARAGGKDYVEKLFGMDREDEATREEQEAILKFLDISRSQLTEENGQELFKRALNDKVDALNQESSAASGVELSRLQGMIDGLRAVQAQGESELVEEVEGEDDELTPEDQSAQPTVAAAPGPQVQSQEESHASRPMSRDDALTVLRLKDRRMAGRSILSKPEIEAAYAKELKQARDIVDKQLAQAKNIKDPSIKSEREKIAKDSLKQTEEEFQKARDMLLNEVDQRVVSDQQKVSEEVATVKKVLGKKFEDDPNVKAKDREVIEQAFERIATRVAEQLVKRGESFSPAHLEHANRLEGEIASEINRNPQFKTALSDPDVSRALKQASTDPGGTTATRTVAKQAARSYRSAKMYDDVDSTLKKLGIATGTIIAVGAILAVVVAELMQNNIIQV